MAKRGRPPKHITDAKAQDGALVTFVGDLANKIAQKDVVANSTYTYDFRLLQEWMENAYQQSWIAKRLVELPVAAAMRNGFNLEMSDPENISKVMDAYRQFELDELISDTQKWADVYGSSIILLRNETEDPQKPYTNFKKLEFTQVQFPFYMPQPSSHDPYVADSILVTLLGLKETSERPTSSNKVLLKASLDNVAIFKGVPVIKRLSPQFKYFGMSVYQNIWKTMISDELMNSACANIVYKSSFRNYKIKGFGELIASGNQNLVLNRLQVSDLIAGIYGSNVMDSEDTLEILQQSLAGLADLDRRSVERLSAATGIPATILLGKSPDGMNATGEHDEKNFYVFVQQYQRKMLPAVTRIFDALIQHLGIEDPYWKISFNPPHTKDSEDESKVHGMFLDNALKMQSLGVSDDIIKRYLHENQLINDEEHARETIINEDFNADSNSGLEDELESAV